jgi:hypothetical protein
MTLIRTEPFVPLTSTAPATSADRGGFQATVVSQPEQMQKFHPMESSAGAGANRASNCEPRVTVQREGDRVAGIRIQCSCGQVIDLACTYELEPAAPQA